MDGVMEREKCKETGSQPRSCDVFVMIGRTKITIETLSIYAPDWLRLLSGRQGQEGVL